MSGQALSECCGRHSETSKRKSQPALSMAENKLKHKWKRKLNYILVRTDMGTGKM